MGIDAGALLRNSDGVLVQREHPRAAIKSLLAADRIVRVHPGVFVDTELLWSRHTRLAAALAARPSAVLWRASAVAAITFSKEPFVKGERVELAQPSDAPGPGLRITRRLITTVRRFNGLRCPAPAVVAVEAAARDDGRTAELFLREGTVRPYELVDALAEFAGSRHQRIRSEVVRSFADNPWSGGERELQQLLRGAGISGWVANAELRLAGCVCYPDVLFPDARVILEFDGYEVHGTRQAFESDRVRQNRLVLARYTVLRITWRRLQDDPDAVLAEIRAALALGEPQVC
ncbi:MAG: DUF559 domain-containing protein [Micropruina sp.]|uniref:endonuclease domain-containing protein n=1 Tax=Micropruina sp. TaxID=2737536 RepID=UPI0039E56EB5